MWGARGSQPSPEDAGGITAPSPSPLALMPKGPWPALALAALLFLIPPSPPPSGQPHSLRDLLPYPKPERETWVAVHLRLKASLHLLFGEKAARAYDRLLRLEAKNQHAGRHSAFKEPKEALLWANRWVEALGRAKRRRPIPLKGLPMVPEHTLPHAQAIRKAAHALRIPPGILAAIVDNEQYGGDKALGLARGIREAADGLAEVLPGPKPFARTLGLAQMAWEDALRQKPRLLAFGAWDPLQPFPQNEPEARRALADPYLNLLFTASRLRGFLEAALGRKDPGPLEDPWVYYLGPAWHNRPFLAQSLETSPYSFHAFFKGLLYETLLEEGPWALRGETLIPLRALGPGEEGERPEPKTQVAP